MIKITEMLAPAGSKCRPGRLRTGFVGVSIHNTGNASPGSGAQNHGLYLQGGGAKVAASWHYAVDEAEAVRSIPESEIAYHAGDGTGNGNYKTIAIEICMNSDGDLKKATDNAAELAADILKRNSIEFASSYLYQHHDWSGKNCPQMIRANKPYSWVDFVAKVQSHIYGVSAESEKEEKLKTYNYIDEVPEYGRDAVNKAVENGYIAKDDNGKFYLLETSVQPAVWQYLNGGFDKKIER